MKVAVIGLGHLGTVTAACAAGYFDVAAYDSAPERISEPGLDEALRAGRDSGRLSFKSSLSEAVKGAEVIWFTHETPVDEDDVADVGFLEKRMKELLPIAPEGAIILISSQVPVGFTAWAEAAFKKLRPQSKASFACSPENLQLGRALDAFRRPERVIVGARDSAAYERLVRLFGPFCQRLEKMSPESAEMTKHALNAFLATSVVFINEAARLCEKVGADAKEVERGLKSEPRIGAKAYLRPGGAFSGGTLARDINYLVSVAKKTKTPSTLFAAVYKSNEDQKLWPREQLKTRLRSLKGKTIAVWGLAYKPGTNSIRRSEAIDLCRWLLKSGSRVQAYDPAVRTLPAALKAVTLCDGAADALRGADALVVAVEWPDFRMVPVRTSVVVDAGGFLRRPS